jgi:hypothetical protein
MVADFPVFMTRYDTEVLTGIQFDPRFVVLLQVHRDSSATLRKRRTMRARRCRAARRSSDSTSNSFLFPDVFFSGRTTFFSWNYDNGALSLKTNLMLMLCQLASARRCFASLPVPSDAGHFPLYRYFPSHSVSRNSRYGRTVIPETSRARGSRHTHR